MADNVHHAFPAGYESDESQDEWDVGYSPTTEPPGVQGSEAAAELVEDDVSRLKQAISSSNVCAVEQLLDKGVDVETCLGFGWTPLLCAVNMANYNIAKLLLDRGASANFSKDQCTTLMGACMASGSEDAIIRCVELLLSRHADSNMVDREGMTCLMLAARKGYSKLINLLVSHGARINVQNFNGYTALSVAVQYGREEAVLKLLQLGADKSIRTKDGKSPAQLALILKHTPITRILAAPVLTTSSLKANAPSNALENDSELPTSSESHSKLGDIALFLHGLNLGYLTDVMIENDITWSCLLTMEKEDLDKIGITKPEDQLKVLKAVQEMHVDGTDLEILSQLDGVDSGEELHNFLISLHQQCCYLTETVQDVIRRFPQRTSEVVFSLDPKKEAQTVCNQLVVQTGDLQREITCLRNLLSQMGQADAFREARLPRSHGNRRRLLQTGVLLSVLGAGVLFLFSRGRLHLLADGSNH